MLIELSFDPNRLEESGSEDSFIIEMAPIDEMPHSVYWFLSQVDRGFFDRCGFHQNPGHVIQGGPVPNFIWAPNQNLRGVFEDKALTSVLFQEYSPEFPHEKYTIGYAGRPGGPDFYISTTDNTKIHGPFGQVGYADPSEADPCFAKVVSGFEAVDRMMNIPVQPRDKNFSMISFVAITSMKILQPKEIL